MTTPVGGVVGYAGDAVSGEPLLRQQGWLLCDGSPVSRTVYNLLFTVIGTRHGIGDGSTTFNLPDYRGRFLRGTSGTSGRDPDAASRTAADAGGVSGNETGSVQTFGTAKPQTSFTTDTQGLHNHGVPHVPIGNDAYKIAGSTLAKWHDGFVMTSTDGAHNHTVTGGGDLETRPINAYVDYIIRYQ